MGLMLGIILPLLPFAGIQLVLETFLPDVLAEKIIEVLLFVAMLPLLPFA